MKPRKKIEPSSDVEEVLKTISARIKQQRKILANNYENFAADNGFNKMTIYRLENGKNFNMDTLIRVLRVLNTSIEDFFRGIR